MNVYYNEFDPFAAQWLRSLIAAGELPPGGVDERDVREVRAADLAGYRQCHFFAGIGGWPLALRLAGWPEDRPVWTASLPCQPFSSAGKRRAAADERHLWPVFARLVAECRPPAIFGEQVAARAGRVWLAGVRADLEALGYRVGAGDLCAAGLGAPHIRQRLYWVAYRPGTRSLPGPLSGVRRREEGAGARDGQPERPRAVGGVAHARRADDERQRGLGAAPGAAQTPEGEARERQRGGDAARDRGQVSTSAERERERGTTDVLTWPR